MAKLSPHFSVEEFEVGGNAIAPELLPLVSEFCEKVLEPIRTQFNAAMRINSGNRNVDHNAAVGGAAHSQHVYTAEHCACDFAMAGVDLALVFNWIRLSSNLPFDQLIFERDKKTNVPSCIHVSYATTQRREALVGFTHGAGGYTQVAVA